MADNTRDILIMGIGNSLLGDEGLGIHAIRELKKNHLPDNVELLDAGTAFIDAVPFLDNRKQIIIIDAVKGGEIPGSVYRIQVDPDSYVQESATIHGMSIINMFAFARCPMPETVTIIGVEPDVMEWSMELSERVSAALPHVVNAVLSEIGHCFETKNVYSEKAG